MLGRAGKDLSAVKKVRTDGGGEYESLGRWCRTNGIEHQTTVPYTPQQNGYAEALGKALVNGARALLVDSGLPKYLWVHAVATANHARNRAPAKDQNKTPLEILTGKKPDISYMRVFGSLAYPMIPKKLRGGRLAPVAATGRFVGYAEGVKGYIIYIPEKHKVVTARNVVFDEKPQGACVCGAEHDSSDWLQDLDNEDGLAATTHADGKAPEPAAVATTDDPMAAETVTAGNPAAEAAIPAATETIAARVFDRPRRGTLQKSGKVMALGAMAAIRTGFHSSEGMVVPTSFAEAAVSPQHDKWRAAMDAEMESQRANGTFTLERVKPGVKPITSRWVFDIKSDGTFKARLVAKGFQQRYGVDFNETYAPASRHSSFRMLLALVAPDPDTVLHQLDVSTAFLNADLEEDIYIQQPEGYVEGGPEICWRLQKALYGLKQAGRQWWKLFVSELHNLGFEPIPGDPTLFKRCSKDTTEYVLAHVDDCIVGGQVSKVLEVKKRLGEIFKIKDLGELSKFLGMEVVRKAAEGTIFLSQQQYTYQILERFSMSEAVPNKIPMDTGMKLRKCLPSESEMGLLKLKGQQLDEYRGQFVALPEDKAAAYGSIVGAVMYLAGCTRPDISYAVAKLGRYTSAPTWQHWGAAQSLLRYLAGTRDYGIVFGSRSGLEAFSDADYAGCVDTRKSTTGSVFILNGGAITWSSRTQPTVASSTMEAEYMAASGTAKEALWLKKVLPKLGVSINHIEIHCDNESCLALLKNPMETEKSKHISIHHHFVRERIDRKEIQFSYVPSSENVADVFTKALGVVQFNILRERLGVVPARG